MGSYLRANRLSRLSRLVLCFFLLRMQHFLKRGFKLLAEVGAAAGGDDGWDPTGKCLEDDVAEGIGV